jgi:hypothetical protein
LKDFSGKDLHKVVFLLAFEEGSHLRDKIGKICDSFMATRFQLPRDGHGDINAFKRKIKSVEEKTDETK